MCCGLSLSGPGAEPGLKARMLAWLWILKLGPENYPEEVAFVGHGEEEDVAP